MNIFSIGGVVGTFAVLIIGIAMAGIPLAAFADLASVIIVVGASFCCLLTGGAKFGDSLGVPSLIAMTFKTPTFGEQEIARKLLSFSEKARREGLLSLEDEIQDLDNDFLRTGLRLSIDGTDHDIILTLLESEISKLQERHGRKHKVFDLWALIAPAAGMWGTLIGLIGMMRNLDDPSSVGPNMAVALITTLYGSILSNAVIAPWGAKLRTYSAEEVNCREMVVEGVLSIQAGDNPRILGQKLLAFLSPEDRKALEHEVKD